mgnify:CR=1 FL=1
MGAIHTATGGALLPIQVAAEIALKLHAIKSADTANMTPKQYAEFIAEELADITYQVAANKLIQTAKDRGIPQGFVKMTREMLKGDPEVALAGGGSISANVAQPEGPTAINTAILKNGGQEIARGKASTTISQAETSAVKHQFKYHPRIQQRAMQDPIAHNFPYSFDDLILKSEPIMQNDGSLLFRLSGTLNGNDGFFELALNKESKTIFHRTFIRKR